MGNKFKIGETVYAKTDPNIKLVVKRYVDRIYYCQVLGESMQKERVYFERELLDATEMEQKRQQL